MGVAQDENGGRFHPPTSILIALFTGGPDPLNLTPNTGDAIAAMLLGTPSTGGTGIAVSQSLPRLAPWNVFAGRLEGHSESSL